MPPYPYHLLVAAVREHQGDLHREAAQRRQVTRARAEAASGAEGAGRRPLALRLLGRVLGPR